MSALSAAPVAPATTPSAPAPAAAATPAPATPAAATPAADAAPVVPAAAPVGDAEPGFAVKLPQGFEENTDVIEAMKKAGLKTEQGQAMVDFLVSQHAAAQAAAAKEQKALGERLVNEYRNHAEYGGPHLQETDALVQRAEAQLPLQAEAKEFLSFYEGEIVPGVKFKDTVAGKSLMRMLGKKLGEGNSAGTFTPFAKPNSSPSLFSHPDTLAALKGGTQQQR